MYNQLVAWTTIQSYWYYVLSTPRVYNQEFDFIKQVLSLLEGGLLKALRDQGLATIQNQKIVFAERFVRMKTDWEPYGWSPTLLGWNPCNHLVSRYPPYIQEMFRACNLEGNPQTWNWEYRVGSQLGSRLDTLNTKIKDQSKARMELESKLADAARKNAEELLKPPAHSHAKRKFPS